MPLLRRPHRLAPRYPPVSSPLALSTHGSSCLAKRLVTMDVSPSHMLSPVRLFSGDHVNEEHHAGHLILVIIDHRNPLCGLRTLIRSFGGDRLCHRISVGDVSVNGAASPLTSDVRTTGGGLPFQSGPHALKCSWHRCIGRSTIWIQASKSVPLQEVRRVLGGEHNYCSFGLLQVEAPSSVHRMSPSLEHPRKLGPYAAAARVHASV